MVDSLSVRSRRGVVAFDSCQEHAKAKTMETGHRELLAHWST